VVLVSLRKETAVAAVLMQVLMALVAAVVRVQPVRTHLATVVTAALV
jgi:hypothetical protein